MKKEKNENENEKKFDGILNGPAVSGFFIHPKGYGLDSSIYVCYILNRSDINYTKLLKSRPGFR